MSVLIATSSPVMPAAADRVSRSATRSGPSARPSPLMAPADEVSETSPAELTSVSTLPASDLLPCKNTPAFRSCTTILPVAFTLTWLRWSLVSRARDARVTAAPAVRSKRPLTTRLSSTTRLALPCLISTSPRRWVCKRRVATWVLSSTARAPATSTASDDRVSTSASTAALPSALRLMVPCTDRLTSPLPRVWTVPTVRFESLVRVVTLLPSTAVVRVDAKVLRLMSLRSLLPLALTSVATRLPKLVT